MRAKCRDHNLAKRVSALVRAMNTLSAEQGTIARRNARRRVAKELKGLQAQLNKSYPAPPVHRKSTRRRTPQQRARAYERDGWREVSSTVILRMKILRRLAEAGVRVKSLVAGGPEVYAPGWAIDIASMAPEKLARAKASIRERKAVLTELAMSSDNKA